MSNSNQYAYYPAQQTADGLVYGPEGVAYADYHRRSSPRRYGGVEMRAPGTPPTVGQTPLRHVPATSLSYHPQDLIDRREYISRPIATTAVSGSGVSGAGNYHHTTLQNSPPQPPASMADSEHVGSGGGAGAVGYGTIAGKHYHTIPRPIEPRQRYVSGSQQSLRASTSTHEIVQNEVGNNEHYIYVTYPPDLRKRYSDKYE